MCLLAFMVACYTTLSGLPQPSGDLLSTLGPWDHSFPCFQTCNADWRFHQLTPLFFCLSPFPRWWQSSLHWSVALSCSHNLCSPFHFRHAFPVSVSVLLLFLTFILQVKSPPPGNKPKHHILSLPLSLSSPPILSLSNQSSDCSLHFSSLSILN